MKTGVGGRVPKRKPPKRGSVKLWVPPSNVDDGGARKPATPIRRQAPQRAKLWTPAEPTPLEEWNGGAGTKWKQEERRGGVTLIWYWHSPLTGTADSAPGGLVVTGMPFHGRVGCHKNNPSRAPYGDALLDALDPVSSEPFEGYCHECDSGTCAGVQWAIKELARRNPIPF